MSSLEEAGVYRRYSQFGKEINFNNDALAGRIADISINASTNNMTLLSSYGTVYFNNIDTVTVDGDLTFFNTPSVTIDNAPHYALPTGTMIMYPSATPPAGWLICNGQEVSRSTYSLLYSYIGTTYGAGNGSTTFNLPDIRDRMVIHQSPSVAARYNTLGGTGGVKGVIFTEAQLPNHTHDYTGGSTDHIARDSGWSHSHPNHISYETRYTAYSSTPTSGSVTIFASREANQALSSVQGSDAYEITHGHTTNSETSTNIYNTSAILNSSGNPNASALNPSTAQRTFNNIQASQLIYYIIKY